jgi:hypothetical protein
MCGQCRAVATGCGLVASSKGEEALLFVQKLRLAPPPARRDQIIVIWQSVKINKNHMLFVVWRRPSDGTMPRAGGIVLRRMACA